MLTACLLGLALAVPADGAGEWPQFRGPRGAGSAAETATPPLSWGDGRGVKWRAALPGPGSSSPIVVGDKVFVTCYSGYGTGRDGDTPAGLQRHLVALDRGSGKVLWQADVPGVKEEDAFRGYLTEHGYASATPVSDGQAVYAFFGKAGVFAYDLTGRRLWQAEAGTESDPRRWGSGASPIVVGDLVVVNAASESRSVRAYDRKTGKPVWKAEGNRLALSFGTPAVVKVDEGRSDLVVPAPGEVWGLNPETGKLLWWATVRAEGNVSPSVVAGDGVAYVTGGYTSRGTTAVRAGGRGDVTRTHVLWEARASSYVPTPLLHEGRLHWVSEDGVCVCLEARTRKVVYEERLPVRGPGGMSRPFYASVVRAGGRLYAVSRRAGTFVLGAGPKFERLALNTLADDADFNATPAVAGKQLFLRSNKFVYCLESE